MYRPPVRLGTNGHLGGVDGAAGGSTKGRRPSTAAALELLLRSESDLRRLDYSAKDATQATAAFELFSRAVQWVLRTPQKEDDVALENLDRKEEILAFLLDLQERRKLYRSKVASTVLRLLSLDAWRVAAERDASVHAAVRALVEDPEEGAGNKVVHRGVAVNMKTAAEAAEDSGFVGALYVRVIAAYGLPSTSSAPAAAGGRRPGRAVYVRVTIDSKSAEERSQALLNGKPFKRTEVACDAEGGGSPRWDAMPFLMEVPTLSSSITFEVVDNSDDQTVGLLTLPIDSSWRPGKGLARRPLSASGRSGEDRQAGELELELVFQRGRRACVMSRRMSKARSVGAPDTQDRCRAEEVELLTALVKAMEEVVDVDEGDEAEGSAAVQALQTAIRRAREGIAGAKAQASAQLMRVIEDAEAMVETFNEEEGEGWLVADEEGQASHVATKHDPLDEEEEVELTCPAGHELKMQPARWFHKGMKQCRCDACQQDVPKDVERWRCDFPCMYDVCVPCYAQMHRSKGVELPGVTPPPAAGQPARARAP